MKCEKKCPVLLPSSSFKGQPLVCHVPLSGFLWSLRICQDRAFIKLSPWVAGIDRVALLNCRGHGVWVRNKPHCFKPLGFYCSLLLQHNLAYLNWYNSLILLFFSSSSSTSPSTIKISIWLNLQKYNPNISILFLPNPVTYLFPWLFCSGEWCQHSSKDLNFIQSGVTFCPSFTHNPYLIPRGPWV